MTTCTGNDPGRSHKPLNTASRILIVDDHELLRHGLATLLQRQTDLVVCGQAAGEAEAIEMLQSSEPDLVIVDISLADGDGVRLLKQIHEARPQVRTIVASAHDESMYAERALRAGAAGYVNKQEPAHTILDAIRHVLEGKLFFSKRITDRLMHLSRTSHGTHEQSPVELLSKREREVFQRIGQGLSTSQIAEELGLSPRTIETYRERMKVKLNSANATELNLLALRWALEGE